MKRPVALLFLHNLRIIEIQHGSDSELLGAQKSARADTPAGLTHNGIGSPAPGRLSQALETY